jgi:hypothetical protein
MRISDESPKRWRVPVLLFTGACVGAVIFAAAHKKSVDAPHDAATRTAEAPPPYSENSGIASAGGAGNSPVRVNTAMQKPGPPDPEAEKTAAESAERAAEAAAALAASAPGVSH